jgi:hypothetical protein
VGRADLLKPADIDDIVDVAVLVDVGVGYGQGDDEDLAILAGLKLAPHASPATPFSVIRA